LNGSVITKGKVCMAPKVKRRLSPKPYARS